MWHISISCKILLHITQKTCNIKYNIKILTSKNLRNCGKRKTVFVHKITYALINLDD